MAAAAAKNPQSRRGRSRHCAWNYSVTNVARTLLSAAPRLTSALRAAPHSSMEPLPLDIRPEFLQHVRNRIRPELAPEALHRPRKIPIVRIVRIANRRRNPVPQNLGSIESPGVRVSASHQNPRERVPGPPPHRTMHLAKITWILSEHRRQDGFGHQVAHHLIAQ